MVSRPQKQMTIAGVFVLILAMISFGTYWTNFRPPAATPTPIPIQALQVQSVQMAQTPAGDYDVVAQVYNPNTDYGLAGGSFDLVFKDASGNEVARNAGNNFYMLPGQTKQLVLASLHGIPLGATPSLELRSLQWEQVTGDPSVSIVATNQQISNNGQGGSAVFRSTIVNNSVFDFDTVDAAVVVTDPTGKLITASTTNFQTFLSQTKRDIVVTWPFPIPSDAVISVQVGTNVFNNANYLKQHGTPQKFQQYF